MISFAAWWQSRKNPFWNATETVKHSTHDLAQAAFDAGVQYEKDRRKHERQHRDDFTFDTTERNHDIAEGHSQ